MRGGGLEMAVLHVVRARPEDLHRCFRRARNFRRFQRVIDCEPPAESAADQRHLDLTLSGVVPRNCATCFCTRFGAWVGTMILQRSPSTCAMQFIVSSGACA